MEQLNHEALKSCIKFLTDPTSNDKQIHEAYNRLQFLKASADSTTSLSQLCPESLAILQREQLKLIERALLHTAHRNEQIQDGAIAFLSALPVVLQASSQETLSPLCSERLVEAMLARINFAPDKKSLATKSIWCLAHHKFAADVITGKIGSILCKLSLDAQLGGLNSEISPVISHATITLLERYLTNYCAEMINSIDSWLLFCIRVSVCQYQLMHSTALKILEFLVDCRKQHPFVVPNSVKCDIKNQNISKSMAALFGRKQQIHVLRVWELLVALLGKSLHEGSSLLNAILPIVEMAFKDRTDENIRQKAFQCWKALIENFALDTTNVLAHERRLRLLLQPLRTVVTTDSDTVTEQKFRAWWTLVACLGDACGKWFDEACLPFLRFCAGGKLKFIPDQPGDANFNSEFLKASTSTAPTGNSFEALLILPAGTKCAPEFLVSFKGGQTLLGEALFNLVCGPNQPITSLQRTLPTFPVCIFDLPEISFTQTAHFFVQLLRIWYHQVSRTGASKPAATDGICQQCWMAIYKRLSQNYVPNKIKTNYDLCAVVGNIFVQLQLFCDENNLTIEQKIEYLSGFSEHVFSSVTDALVDPALISKSGQPRSLAQLVWHMTLQALEKQQYGLIRATTVLATRVSSLLNRILSVFLDDGPIDQAYQKANNALSKLTSTELSQEMKYTCWTVFAEHTVQYMRRKNEINQSPDFRQHDFSFILHLLALPVQKLYKSTELKEVSVHWKRLFCEALRCCDLLTAPQKSKLCEDFCNFLLKNTTVTTENEALLSLICRIICEESKFDTSQFSKLSIICSPKRNKVTKFDTLGTMSSLVALTCTLLDLFFPSDAKRDLSGAVSRECASNLLHCLNQLLKKLRGAAAQTLMEKFSPFLARVLRLSNQKLCDIKSLFGQVDDCMHSFCVAVKDCAGPFDSTFLFSICPVFCVSFEHNRRAIKMVACDLWASTFAKSSQLDYPSQLREVLLNVKGSLSLICPGLETQPVQFSNSSIPMSAAGVGSSSTFLLCEETEPLNIPILENIDKLPPVLMTAFPSHVVVGPEAKLTELANVASTSTAQAKAASSSLAHASTDAKTMTEEMPTTPKQAKVGSTPRRSALSKFEDMRPEEFVEISPTSKGKLVLTKHQAEKLRERSEMPFIESKVLVRGESQGPAALMHDFFITESQMVSGDSFDAHSSAANQWSENTSTSTAGTVVQVPDIPLTTSPDIHVTNNDDVRNQLEPVFSTTAVDRPCSSGITSEKESDKTLSATSKSSSVTEVATSKPFFTEAASSKAIAEVEEEGSVEDIVEVSVPELDVPVPESSSTSSSSSSDSCRQLLTEAATSSKAIAQSLISGDLLIGQQRQPLISDNDQLIDQQQQPLISSTSGDLLIGQQESNIDAPSTSAINFDKLLTAKEPGIQQWDGNVFDNFSAKSKPVQQMQATSRAAELEKITACELPIVEPTHAVRASADNTSDESSSQMSQSLLEDNNDTATTCLDDTSWKANSKRCSVLKSTTRKPASIANDASNHQIKPTMFVSTESDKASVSSVDSVAGKRMRLQMENVRTLDSADSELGDQSGSSCIEIRKIAVGDATAPTETSCQRKLRKRERNAQIWASKRRRKSKSKSRDNSDHEKQPAPSQKTQVASNDAVINEHVVSDSDAITMANVPSSSAGIKRARRTTSVVAAAQNRHKREENGFSRPRRFTSMEGLRSRSSTEQSEGGNDSEPQQRKVTQKTVSEDEMAERRKKQIESVPSLASVTRAVVCSPMSDQLKTAELTNQSEQSISSQTPLLTPNSAAAKTTGVCEVTIHVSQPKQQTQQLQVSITNEASPLQHDQHSPSTRARVKASAKNEMAQIRSDTLTPPLTHASKNVMVQSKDTTRSRLLSDASKSASKNAVTEIAINKSRSSNTNTGIEAEASDDEETAPSERTNTRKPDIMSSTVATPRFSVGSSSNRHRVPAEASQSHASVQPEVNQPQQSSPVKKRGRPRKNINAEEQEHSTFTYGGESPQTKSSSNSRLPNHISPAKMGVVSVTNQNAAAKLGMVRTLTVEIPRLTSVTPSSPSKRSIEEVSVSAAERIKEKLLRAGLSPKSVQAQACELASTSFATTASTAQLPPSVGRPRKLETIKLPQKPFQQGSLAEFLLDIPRLERTLHLVTLYPRQIRVPLPADDFAASSTSVLFKKPTSALKKTDYRPSPIKTGTRLLVETDCRLPFEFKASCSSTFVVNAESAKITSSDTVQAQEATCTSSIDNTVVTFPSKDTTRLRKSESQKSFTDSKPPAEQASIKTEAEHVSKLHSDTSVDANALSLEEKQGFKTKPMQKQHSKIESNAAHEETSTDKARRRNLKETMCKAETLLTTVTTSNQAAATSKSTVTLSKGTEIALMKPTALSTCGKQLSTAVPTEKDSCGQMAEHFKTSIPASATPETLPQCSLQFRCAICGVDQERKRRLEKHMLSHQPKKDLKTFRRASTGLPRRSRKTASNNAHKAEEDSGTAVISMISASQRRFPEVFDPSDKEKRTDERLTEKRRGRRTSAKTAQDPVLTQEGRLSPENEPRSLRQRKLVSPFIEQELKQTQEKDTDLETASLSSGSLKKRSVSFLPDQSASSNFPSVEVTVSETRSRRLASLSSSDTPIASILKKQKTKESGNTGFDRQVQNVDKASTSTSGAHLQTFAKPSQKTCNDEKQHTKKLHSAKSIERRDELRRSEVSIEGLIPFLKFKRSEKVLAAFSKFNVKTIGEASKLKKSVINQLPIKSPKIAVFRNALVMFHKQQKQNNRTTSASVTSLALRAIEEELCAVSDAIRNEAEEIAAEIRLELETEARASAELMKSPKSLDQKDNNASSSYTAIISPTQTTVNSGKNHHKQPVKPDGQSEKDNGSPINAALKSFHEILDALETKLQNELKSEAHEQALEIHQKLNACLNLVNDDLRERVKFVANK